MLRQVLTACFVTSLVIIFVFSVNFVFGTQDDNKTTLSILFIQIGKHPNAGRVLIDHALDVLNNETGAVTNVKYLEYPYNLTRNETIRLISNQSPIDIITGDQIWLANLPKRDYSLT
jgi:hypothetical protein